MVFINSALGTVAAANLNNSAGIYIFPIVALTALLLTRALSNIIYVGELQHHYLEDQYSELTNRDDFPRPFYWSNQDYTARSMPRRFGTLVREFVIGWSAALAVSLTFLLYRLFNGWYL